MLFKSTKFLPNKYLFTILNQNNMIFKFQSISLICNKRSFTILNLNNGGNYEVSLLNIPSNVSENDTLKWLRPVEVVSCQLSEKGKDNSERQAILEVNSIDACEKIYQKSGKLFFQSQVEVIPTFPSSIQPFYIHKRNNFNLQNWLKPLSCFHTRTNYLIPKYIQIFLDLNEWPSILQHNGKYDVTIFKKMVMESLNKLVINDIPLSISQAALNTIIAPYGAHITNHQKNQDETAFTGILNFKTRSAKNDFYNRKRFLEFDDGYATMETMDELYFIPLNSPLSTNK